MLLRSRSALPPSLPPSLPHLPILRFSLFPNPSLPTKAAAASPPSLPPFNDEGEEEDEEGREEGVLLLLPLAMRAAAPAEAHLRKAEGE